MGSFHEAPPSPCWSASNLCKQFSEEEEYLASLPTLRIVIALKIIIQAQVKFMYKINYNSHTDTHTPIALFYMPKLVSTHSSECIRDNSGLIYCPRTCFCEQMNEASCMKNFECSGRTEKCYTITIGRQPTLVSESESYRKIMILKNSQHYIREFQGKWLQCVLQFRLSKW